MTNNLFIRRTFICLFIMMAQVVSLYADDYRAIPDDNLSYPVLFLSAPVEGKSDTGSGFYYNAKNAVYFVSARHVLFADSSVELKALPKIFKVPYQLIYRIHYDAKSQKLSFSGIMSDNDKAELILNSSKEPIFVQAVEQLHTKSQKLELKKNAASLLSYPKDRTKADSNEIELQLSTLLTNGKITYHPYHDVAAIKIGTFLQPETGERRVKLEDGARLIKGSGITGIDAATNIKPFNEILEGNDIFVFGYPTSISNSNAFLDIKVPLLRKGIVAGKNDRLKVIILDCPVYQGNSGGLVIEVDEKFSNKYFKGIGIITNFVPFRNQGSQEVLNSGYAVAVPIDQVSEIINK